MIKKLLVLIPLFFCVHFVTAQKYAFKEFTTQNGLSSDFVNDIIQTQDGYMWIATKNGVSKFNGKYFEHFNKEKGLNSKNISSLFEDSKGRLWIGSSDKGSSYLENGIITSLEDIHSPNYYSVNDFLEAKDGTIYMFCNNGVIVYKEGLKKVIPLENSDDNSIKPNQAEWIDDNTIYMATLNTGIAILKIDEESITYINNKSHDINNITYSIVKDEANDIWVGTEGELLKLNGQDIVDRYEFDPKEVNINNVSDIVNRSETELLLAFEGNGFTIFNKKTGTYDEMIRQRNGLPHRNVYSIIEDNEGNIWLGTKGIGLVKFRDKGFKLFDDTNGLHSNNIYGMTSTPTQINYTVNGFIYSMTFSSAGSLKNPIDLFDGQNIAQVSSTGQTSEVRFVEQDDFEEVP